jgi:hypothetical protein
MKSVTKILEVRPFSIFLAFDNGEKRWVTLDEKLKNWGAQPDSKFHALLNPEFFKTVKYNPELETIEWENGIDFCPDSLYHWSKSELNHDQTHSDREL